MKLIAIMSDRINQHMKALQAVDWESTKDEGVNGYMTLMTKETMTLHKVLTKFLALPVVEVRLFVYPLVPLLTLNCHRWS